ncbi:hypothetical protein F5Y18DRAFT_206755 [Xylariaceae sp. FL1019]|nr:hypothetical protein F5Y18DRAFT_206755 [Xylariaceae sp. FL1019]
MPPKPLRLPSRALPPASNHHIQRRTFLSSLLQNLPNSPEATQTLTASRRLPYNHKHLYTLISDIDSYSSFLPYCSSSRVTQWTSTPDPIYNRKWPTCADLTAGWGGLEQTYTSRVHCIPGSVVEALSGDGAKSGIPADVLAAHGLTDELGNGNSGRGVDEEGVFKTLVTTWTVAPIKVEGDRREWSDVHLNIRFQFANPLYGAVSSAVADKVAPFMIEAFVKRARKVLGSSD